MKTESHQILPQITKWSIRPCGPQRSLIKTIQEAIGSQFSLRLIKKSIDQGCLFMNGKRCTRSSQVCQVNDQIVFYFVQEIMNTRPFVIKDNIIFEDDYLICFNKPPYVPSDQKDKSRHNIESLVKEYYKNGKKYKDMILLHRLDKDTSGVLVFVKEKKILSFFIRQFKEKRVKKKYLAFIKNQPQKNKGIIQTFIRKKMGSNNIYEISKKSKDMEAVTHYQVLERYQKASMIELRPITGRTHQLRIHLKYLNTELLGDRIYGTQMLDHLFIPRQLLHAQSMIIAHPQKKEILIEAPLPNDFITMKRAILKKSKML